VEWSSGLLDVVSWSEIVAILALYWPSLAFLLYDFEGVFLKKINPTNQMVNIEKIKKNLRISYGILLNQTSH
jgi:hypothetical protein